MWIWWFSLTCTKLYSTCVVSFWKKVDYLYSNFSGSGVYKPNKWCESQFDSCAVFKPKASRSWSQESYIIAGCYSRWSTEFTEYIAIAEYWDRFDCCDVLSKTRISFLSLMRRNLWWLEKQTNTILWKRDSCDTSLETGKSQSNIGHALHFHERSCGVDSQHQQISSDIGSDASTVRIHLFIQFAFSSDLCGGLDCNERSVPI